MIEKKRVRQKEVGENVALASNTADFPKESIQSFAKRQADTNLLIKRYKILFS